MNLVNISKEERGYKIKSIKYIKLLGTSIYSSHNTFSKEFGKDQWINEKNNKPASEPEAVKLDKWLRDHKKFIEKD